MKSSLRWLFSTPAVFGVLLSVLPGVTLPNSGDSGRLFYSSNLNWKPGQDVTAQFSQFVAKVARPGDALVLDQMYGLSAGAQIQLPDYFTLTAENGGGFDMQDTASSNRAMIFMGDGGTLNNVTIIASGAPRTTYKGLNAVRGVDFDPARAVGIHDVNNVTLTNNTFSGNIGQFVNVHNSNNLVVQETRFVGARTHLLLGGNVADALIYRSFFEEALGDGIKTIDGNIVRPRVIESIFKENNRDGIDTTGGFRGALVKDSGFYGNASAMDIKTLVHDSNDLGRPDVNSDIRVEGAHITGSGNAIVTTFRDFTGQVTAEVADDFIPNGIVVVDSTFEDVGTAFLVKDGYDINWSDVTFNNVRTEVRILNKNAPTDWHRLNDNTQNIGASYVTKMRLDLRVDQAWQQEPDTDLQ